MRAGHHPASSSPFSSPPPRLYRTPALYPSSHHQPASAGVLF